MDHITTTVQHLLRMARNPGAVDHARLRVKQIVASDPMYECLPNLLREAMRSEPTLLGATDTATIAQGDRSSRPNASTAAAGPVRPADSSKSGPSRRQSSRAR